jgi:hypothetical protein
MTSSGRELLKWIAVVLMTGDHAVKVLALGYVPVVSELGRVAFPVFALVMAYNLAQPGADLTKSVRRLFVWGLVATPVAMVAFGELLPLNVLLTFSLAAGLVWCIQERQWAVAALCGLPASLLVDYQFVGVLVVLAGWLYFRRPGARAVLVVASIGLLCLYNGNGWAFLGLPVLALGQLEVRLPRTRWAFYGYYVGHLGLLSMLAVLPRYAF